MRETNGWSGMRGTNGWSGMSGSSARHAPRVPTGLRHDPAAGHWPEKRAPTHSSRDQLIVEQEQSHPQKPLAAVRRLSQRKASETSVFRSF